MEAFGETNVGERSILRVYQSSDYSKENVYGFGEMKVGEIVEIDA